MSVKPLLVPAAENSKPRWSGREKWKRTFKGRFGVVAAAKELDADDATAFTPAASIFLERSVEGSCVDSSTLRSAWPAVPVELHCRSMNGGSDRVFALSRMRRMQLVFGCSWTNAMDGLSEQRAIQRTCTGSTSNLHRLLNRASTSDRHAAADVLSGRGGRQVSTRRRWVNVGSEVAPRITANSASDTSLDMRWKIKPGWSDGAK